MLERTAGCLESGSLRRLLPSSKKSLKSRRTLHSSFWHHGAGDLELSPLWAALVRVAEPVDQQNEVLQKPSTSHSTTLLDFLCPAGTINFLQQYSGWGVDRQEGKWGRRGLGKLGYRQYTSSAKDTTSTERTSQERVIREEESADLKTLYERFGLAKSYDYEEAWRQYMLLDAIDQHLLRKPLMQYLSNSDRVVDAERVTELFDMLREVNRDSKTYQYTIRAHLKLRNLADAMELQKTAFETLRTPAGTAELLAHFVQNASWVRAFSFWTEFQQRKKEAFFEGFFEGYDIFELAVTLPNLGDQAIELAEYVSRRIRNTPPDSTEDNSELIQFASMVVRKTLNTRGAFNPSKFSTLLEFLRLWKVDWPVVYEEAIATLLSLNQPKWAVKCYRQARQGRGANLRPRTLHQVLEVLCYHHSILGMRQVLDDFFKHWVHPTTWAYKLCMREFASQGDATTTHALFEQFLNNKKQMPNGGPHNSTSRLLLDSADEIAPLLHVHAKRGEVRQVATIFNQIETVYQMQPTILCWNILLDAYGKVHDTSSAYECFERILESPNLCPDNYTFGTMMGICAHRGDLERVIELYMLAEQLKVPKSAAMLDSLVAAYISEGNLQQAERVCEDGVQINLKGSRTRMWNYLLVAYALRRDLKNVNRVLQRMAEANINYDEYTYSALMQSLCMVKQPNKAYDILKEVMVEAGVKATSFHYAIIMGGFLATGEARKVFAVQRRMERRNVRGTSSSSLMAFKATVAEDERLLNEGAEEEILKRAKQMFQNVVASADPQDVSQGPRIGHGRQPLDVAQLSPFYSYIMFVLGQHEDFETVHKLYEEFKRTIPESRRHSPPIPILTALMSARLQERNFEGVEECWSLLLAQAVEEGRTRPLPANVMKNALPKPEENRKSSDGLLSQPHEDGQLSINVAPDPEKIIPAHHLDLAMALAIYLRSLVIQHKVREMTETVKQVLSLGFSLNNHTWNKYVQYLSRKQQYHLAFKVCEEKLMPGWTGWAMIRWTLPVRNRLPIELRRARQWPTHLRPLYYTMLYLARNYIELQDEAAESPASENALSDLERDCPMTVDAIKTMPRTDDEEERHILRGRT